MTVRRTLAALGLAPLLLLTATPAPARAHGATTDPVSRAAVCAPGERAALPVCGAAVAAGGGEPLTDWDNLRRANVRGRDRDAVPDGRLCSGGIDRFAGLDLARDDWPVTRLRAGARLTFGYRTTIPHRGTFRLYLTRDGYDPTRPLRWSDLDTRPFLIATDPPRRSGAYAMTGALPARTGRHVIYTIWQNSDTPDTYYSCSDVLLIGASGAAPKPAPTAAPTSSASAGGGASEATTPPPPTPPPPTAPVAAARGGLDPVSRVEDDRLGRLALPATAAALLLVGVPLALTLRRRRRRS